MSEIYLLERTHETSVHCSDNFGWFDVNRILSPVIDTVEYSFFNPMEATFPRGFTPLMAEQLYQCGHQVTWQAEPRAQRQTNTAAPLGGSLRHFQPWVVEQMAQHRYGIIDIATRFGKSYVYAGWYAAIGRPMTLLLVPTSAIAKQMHDELEAFLGEPVGIVASTVSKEHIWQNITIAIEKSFFGQDGLVKPEHRPYLKAVEARIRDESHVHGDLMVALYRQMPNVMYCWAGSATPLVADELKNWVTTGWHGPVRVRISARFLADQGIIAPVKSIWLPYLHPSFVEKVSWEIKYHNCIVVNEHRNALVSDLAMLEMQQGNTGIIFIEHVAQAERIQANIPGALIVASKLVSHKQAEEIKVAFNSGQVRCVICTKKWREGVTVNCDFGINAGGLKAEHIVVQKLGRGLLPKADGAHFRWYDFFDQGETTIARQALERIRAIDHQEWERSFYFTVREYALQFVDPVRQALLELEDHG